MDSDFLIIGSGIAGLSLAIKLSELVKEAKKEGRLNTIALPPDWANYGQIISTFSKKSFRS